MTGQSLFRSPPGRRVAGVTLIELIIALAIGAILALAMSAVFVKVIESRTEIDRTGQKLENGRYAMDVLGEEIRLAGFYGGYRPPSVTSVAGGSADWQRPSPCETAIASLGFAWIDTATAARVPVPVMGFEGHDGTNLTASGDLAACAASLPNYRVGTDVLVVRRVSTVEVTPGSGAVVGEAPYLQVSACNGDLQDFVFATGSATASFTLKRGDAALGSPICLQTNPVTGMRQFLVKIYYVAACDVCTGTPDAIPTLKEVSLDVTGGALGMSAPRSLVPGIEDLHVDFGIDTTGDGAIDAAGNENYRESDSTPMSSAPFDWQSVMSVRVFVIARDLQPTNGYTDTKVYKLGTHDVSPPANSPFKRRVFSSVFRLPNLVGRREREGA